MKIIRGIIVVAVMVLTALPALQLRAQERRLNDGREGAHNAWLRSIIDHRQKKDREFKNSATSPLAAVKRFTAKTKVGQTIHISTK